MKPYEEALHKLNRCIRCKCHKTAAERTQLCTACLNLNAIRMGNEPPPRGGDEALQEALRLFKNVAHGGCGMGFAEAARKAGVTEKRFASVVRRYQDEQRKRRRPTHIVAHSTGSKFRIA